MASRGWRPLRGAASTFEVNRLFHELLEAHFPERAARLMNPVRDMRGGKDCESDISKRVHVEDVWTELIRQRFNKTVARLCLGGGGRFKRLDTTRFLPRLVVAAAAGMRQELRWGK